MPTFDDVVFGMVRVSRRLSVLPRLRLGTHTEFTWDFSGTEFDPNDTVACDAVGQCTHWRRGDVTVVWFPRVGQEDAHQPIFARVDDLEKMPGNSVSEWNEVGA